MRSYRLMLSKYEPRAKSGGRKIAVPPKRFARRTARPAEPAALFLKPGISRQPPQEAFPGDSEPAKTLIWSVISRDQSKKLLLDTTQPFPRQQNQEYAIPGDSTLKPAYFRGFREKNLQMEYDFMNFWRLRPGSDKARRGQIIRAAYDATRGTLHTKKTRNRSVTGSTIFYKILTFIQPTPPRSEDSPDSPCATRIRP